MSNRIALIKHSSNLKQTGPLLAQEQLPFRLDPIGAPAYPDRPTFTVMRTWRAFQVIFTF